VEDDQAIREAVAAALGASGYRVHALEDGIALGDVVRSFAPDAAVLDIRLPHGPDGYAMGRQLRSADVPVLFLTAADSVDARLRGFDAGADDYLVKPFAMAELLARLRVVLRRAGRDRSGVVEVFDLAIDTRTHRVRRNGSEVDLTKTEYDLLRALAHTPGGVLSKVELLSQVWGFTEYHPNLVEVHVSALRRKLELFGPRIVQTERGEGYVLRP
jgi:DNA-binding response OmpR family regulator